MKNSNIKLHLGCGTRNFGTDWIHIDATNHGSHIKYNDITNLSFDDNSVHIIYASHVISYFDSIEIKPILLEWKRVLSNDGILRLAVPNFKAMAELYINNNLKLTNLLGPLYGKMISGNKLIYHKTTYDLTTISTLLSDIGFKNIRPYDWRNTDHSQFDDHSQAYIPHMDKENGTLISLNVECNK